MPQKTIVRERSQVNLKLMVRAPSHTKKTTDHAPAWLQPSYVRQVGVGTSHSSLRLIQNTKSVRVYAEHEGPRVLPTTAEKLLSY